MHYCICDYVSDIVHNSIEAGSLNIELVWTETDKLISLKIVDDGCGMDEATLEKALNPFYTDGSKHKGRTVGLGLPFLKQAAKSTGGEFEIKSEKGKGTLVNFSFDKTHIDMPAIGSIKETIVGLFSFIGEFELKIKKQGVAGEYEFSRAEISQAVGGFDWSEGMKLLREYIYSIETV